MVYNFVLEEERSCLVKGDLFIAMTCMVVHLGLESVSCRGWCNRRVQDARSRCGSLRNGFLK